MKIVRPYDETHKIIDKIQYKLCSDCNEWHPLNEDYFYRNKSSPDGFNPYCKEATKRRSRKWNLDNYDRYKENRKKTEEKPRTKLLKREMNRKLASEGKRKQWQVNNKDKLYEYGRQRALHKTHEISKEEWEYCLEYFNHSCAYCGLAEKEHKELYNQKLHKEHVNPFGDNDLSNNIPSCKICNSKKHDFTLEEWYKEDNQLCGCFSEERLQKIIDWLEIKYKIK